MGCGQSERARKQKMRRNSRGSVVERPGSIYESADQEGKEVVMEIIKKLMMWVSAVWHVFARENEVDKTRITEFVDETISNSPPLDNKEKVRVRVVAREVSLDVCKPNQPFSSFPFNGAASNRLHDAVHRPQEQEEAEVEGHVLQEAIRNSQV